jgi:hypothetical protein
MKKLIYVVAYAANRRTEIRSNQLKLCRQLGVVFEERRHRDGT